MTQTQHTLRNAGSAIAAALAIASTPGFAQDAAAPYPAYPEPVIVVPDVPVPVAPEPIVVLPSAEPETVQPLPETTAETPAPQPVPAATASRSRVTAPAARAAPEPAPRAAAAEPAVINQTAAVAPVRTVEPVAAEAIQPVTIAEPARTSANDNTGIVALILGGLAFLALAIWGFIAIGRRKPVRRYAAEASAPKPARVAPKPIVVEQAPVAMREPVDFTVRTHTPLSTASFVPRATPLPGALPHTGASVALPALVPQNYAERDELMKRMIAARPDRANPFTDRGARTRRARLILQSLGRDFGESEPWIDLSQYPHNWPELADKRTAAA